MILDVIGHQLVNAELTKAGFALVKILLFFSLNIFMQVWQKTVSLASL